MSSVGSEKNNHLASFLFLCGNKQKKHEPMGIDSIRFTNKILLIFAVVLALYILKVLSFIFVPLAFACFFSIMFLPFLRWTNKQRMPKYFSLIMVMVIIALVLVGSFKILQLSGSEILEGRAEMYEKLDMKLGRIVEPYIQLFEIEVNEEDGLISGLVHNSEVTKAIVSLVGPGLVHIKNFSSTVAITLFLMVLIMAGSINFKLIMQETLFSTPTQAIDVFLKIENAISKFLSVKIGTSLITGICFGIACWAFGVSFPLLWGILAFGLNFIQMLGSIFVTIAVCLMAVIDIEHPGVLTAAIVIFIGIQLLVGSVLEPVLMGKSFKINIVTVLIMLLFWGFLWGIAGMILAVPMAVLIKILCEQFEHTQGIARIMS